MEVHVFVTRKGPWTIGTNPASASFARAGVSVCIALVSARTYRWRQPGSDESGPPHGGGRPVQTVRSNSKWIAGITAIPSPEVPRLVDGRPRSCASCTSGARADSVLLDVASCVMETPVIARSASHSNHQLHFPGHR